jgi:hypothetical protein
MEINLILKYYATFSMLNYILIQFKFLIPTKRDRENLQIEATTAQNPGHAQHKWVN